MVEPYHTRENVGGNELTLLVGDPEWDRLDVAYTVAGPLSKYQCKKLGSGDSS